MFKINGEEWRIVAVSPFHPYLAKPDGGFTVGACDDFTKKIYLNENLTGSFMRKVLCHEIAHAAMFSYNIDLTIEQEEILADLIATYGQEIVHITNLVFKRIMEKRGRL